MKYGRWKKRNRELAAEYESARMQPDCTPAIQAAIDIATGIRISAEAQNVLIIDCWFESGADKEGSG